MKTVLPILALSSLLVPLAAQSTIPVITPQRADGATPPNGLSEDTSTSDDGRYVAFTSTATNFGPTDSNGVRDIYRWDRLTDSFLLVSRPDGSTTLQTNGSSFHPSISPDGRFVAFASTATNLLESGSTTGQQVWVRDTVTSRTVLVSAATNGDPGNGASSQPDIATSAHAEIGTSAVVGNVVVAFQSLATDLIASDGNGAPDVFARLVESGTTIRVNRRTNPMEETIGASEPSISKGRFAGGTPAIGEEAGRYIAYASFDSGIVASDTNFTEDVFVFDRFSQVTVRASVTSSGIEGNGASNSPSIAYCPTDVLDDSSFGLFDKVVVAFRSYATNLTPTSGGGTSQVYAHEFENGTTRHVSYLPIGTHNNSEPAISFDGDRVAFTSLDTFFGSYRLVMREDISSGTRVLATMSALPSSTSVDGDSFEPSISGDGVVVCFTSDATVFEPGNNMLRDVFSIDTATPGAVPYGRCSGDLIYSQLLPQNQPARGSTFDLTAEILLGQPSNPSGFLLISTGRLATPISITGASGATLDAWIDPTSASIVATPYNAATRTFSASIPLPAGLQYATRLYFQHITTGTDPNTGLVNLDIASNAVAAVVK